MSDYLLFLTVLGYLAAMLVHAADYAFGRRGAVAKAVERTREPALVGAGAPAEPPVSAVEQRPTAPAWPRLSRAAVAVTGLAVAAHAATVVTRALEADRMPWGNMYEYVLTGTLIGAVIWVGLVLTRPAIVHLGLFIALSELLLTGVAAVVLRKPVGPLVPALDSYWFVIHVGAAALASGLFLVGFAAAVMYLLRSGYDAGKRGGLYPYGKHIASAEAVERLSFRLHAFGFPIWTFAVAAGAIWAEAAWGRYWGWDPKEAWAFISWVVYACYLHARATPSVKRHITAWIAIVGWLTILMNLFGVNLFYDNSLHSYGGV